MRHRGLQGTKDGELMTYIVTADLTLVTHNSRDFRGSWRGPSGGVGGLPNSATVRLEATKVPQVGQYSISAIN